MKVRYTSAAARRFSELVDELRAMNPFAVENLGRRVSRSIRRLSTFPASGPGVPEFPELGLRQFFVEPYRFFYYVDDARQTVWIVGVWHGAQLPEPPTLPHR